MNVLHIIDLLGYGGSQSLLKALFENQKENKSITLFSVRKVEQSVYIDHQNIIKSKSPLKFSIYPVFQILRLIKNRNITILHCHLLRSQVFGIIVKLLSSKKLELVFHEHGQIFGSENKFKIDDFFYIWFLKFFGYKVNQFIAVSIAVKNKLITRANVNPSKIVVLYNFISNNFTPVNLNITINNRSDLFYVGFAGRLVNRKGWKVFLEAAKILKNHPNIKFIVAGNGPDKNKLLNTISADELKSKVEYIGYVSDIKIDFYSKINCLVIPSEWEPMGLVELEAQAMRIPVIASDVEGLNEIVVDGKTGLLFKMNDAHDLTTKILLSKNNNTHREYLTETAYQNSKKFNCADYCISLNEIYTKIKNERQL